MKYITHRLFILATLIVGMGAISFGANAETPQSNNPILEQMRKEFQNPSQEHTQIPFWFWNDELTDDGIKQQIAWMHEHGVYGFLPHARIGLSKKIGYMTDEWLRLLKVATEEAAERGMMVYLYDEGMYPSGSAHGEVVKDHPEFASQGLQCIREDFKGPETISVTVGDVKESDQLVAIMLLKKSSPDTYDPDSCRVISTKVASQVLIPDGVWTLFKFVQTPSGGVIRGVHWDEEDNKPGAPPSADLLNPKATERFIELTHERFYKALGSHFGKTIRGIFTDEPDIQGRGSRRGLEDWTTGFLDDISAYLSYDFEPYLPFLWVEANNDLHEVIRHDFQCAVDDALLNRYYKPLSEWCANHNIALTGHPAGHGDMQPVQLFHEPGQDIVWRWILPGKTSIEGEASTLGKSSSSVAFQMNRKIIINECYGAYGWRLTMNEMKWLADWLFVRGTNRLFPHAFYYSVRDKRIYERPPDLSWFNLWSENYKQFSDYTNRISWLLSGGKPVTSVAILTVAGHTPWQAAKTLFENQIDFHYLDESMLDQIKLNDEKLTIGDCTYSALILDGITLLHSDTAKRLIEFANQGVSIISTSDEFQLHPLRGEQSPALLQSLLTNQNIRRVKNENDFKEQVKKQIPSDVTILYRDPSDLRILHYVKNGIDFYFITNEGENPIATSLGFKQTTIPEVWDAETGEARPIINAKREGSLFRAFLELPPRQSTIIVFDPQGTPINKKALAKIKTGRIMVNNVPVNGAWTLDVNGTTHEDFVLQSWTKLPDCESFSGTAWYQTEVEIPGMFYDVPPKKFLNLGKVKDIAEVWINGNYVGTRLWQPYTIDVTKYITWGKNTIRIGVTNTRANELTKEKFPSGLFGPVDFSHRMTIVK